MQNGTMYNLVMQNGTQSFSSLSSLLSLLLVSKFHIAHIKKKS
jgi:hypothetical protein